VVGQSQPLRQAVLRSLCVHIGCVTLSFPPWHTVDLCVNIHHRMSSATAQGGRGALTCSSCCVNESDGADALTSPPRRSWWPGRSQGPAHPGQSNKTG
jgi:hypothetical protein